jgi:hypothetical protein
MLYLKGGTLQKNLPAFPPTEDIIYLTFEDEFFFEESGAFALKFGLIVLIFI